MATDTPFLAKTTTKTVAATPVAASAVFSDADKDGDCLRLVVAAVVTGTIVFVKAGVGPQTASGVDLPIPAVAGVYFIGVAALADTVSVAIDAGSATIYITKGEGI